jgi:hypothetical protein
MIDGGQLRDLIHYDPETGVFMRDGRRVGCPNNLATVASL